jgi:DNA-binding NarL/FixJ family response regulator
MNGSLRSSVAAPLRILIVDDFEPFRSSLRQLLNGFSRLTVVGEAIDGKSAIEMASDLVPQVITMDVMMPCMGGAEATRSIKKVLPGTHVISISSQDDTLTQDAMTAAGSSAFITKDCAHTLPGVIARITGLQIGGDPFLEGSV